MMYATQWKMHVHTMNVWWKVKYAIEQQSETAIEIHTDDRPQQAAWGMWYTEHTPAIFNMHTESRPQDYPILQSLQSQQLQTPTPHTKNRIPNPDMYMYIYR